MQGRLPYSADILRWIALLTATALTTVAFYRMTVWMLVPLVMAAIAAAMAEPLNARLTRMLGGRKTTASSVTLILMMIAVVLPILGLVAVAVSQADALARGVSAIMGRLGEIDLNQQVPPWLPFEGELGDLWPKVVTKLADLLQATVTFFLSSVSSMTVGAAAFFLSLFVFFYALFHFLQMETPVLVQLLRFSGLTPATQVKLYARIMSVSRATIKGTLIIAGIQGVLGGLAFWLAGIPGAVFWTVVMMVMAMMPAFGAPAVLFGGAVFLAVHGEWVAAVTIAVWAAAVVSTIDNLLRPVLVGRDARLHDLMILVSTLGGLSLFGAAGLILGPVLAGVFVTVWETLAETASRTAGADAAAPEPRSEAEPGR